MSKSQQQKYIPLSFLVKSLGSVRSGEFIQRPLTVFCGPNNRGKTWVMYALHSFYKLAEATCLLGKEGQQAGRSNGKQKEIERKTSLNYFNKALGQGLGDYLNAPRELAEAVFKCTVPNDKWSQWIKRQPPEVFLMPAERNGLLLFYRELSTKRTALLHYASKENINVNDLLRNVTRSRYAQPIADYIDWLNELTYQQKRSNNKLHDEAQFLQKKMVHGKYNLDRRTGDITYRPYKNNGIPVQTLGLHTTSSTVKSLFGLWFYLENQAETGDILMIDEPELNIHPGNQLLIANLLAKLVNSGIKVVISTHSDYIVREFNNLVMLGEEGNEALMKSLGYEQEAILKREQVGSYLFDKSTIKEFSYVEGGGFAISTFDEVIARQNDSNSEIYFASKYRQETDE